MVNEIDFLIVGQHDHIWVEFPTEKGEKVLCGCIYRSPSNDIDLASCKRSTDGIRQLITKAYEYNNTLIVAGNFNYKNIEWENEFVRNGHKHLMEFIETIHDCFLHQHVSEPTRYRENEESNLLDLILTSEVGMVHNLAYHPPLGESDHICLTFTLQYCQQDQRHEPKHNVFKTNYGNLKRLLSDQDWRRIFNGNFQNDYIKFTNILTQGLEQNSPLTTSPKKKKNLYMTSEAIRQKNKKARLWKKYIYTKSHVDREKYIRCKNKLRLTTRIARSDFEKNLALSVKLNPKSFWKYAKSRLKTRASIPALDEPDGTKAVLPDDKANALNKYFNSMFTVENIVIPLPTEEFKGEILSNITITPDLVWKKLKTLNANKSQGPDKWHPFFLKELADEICIPLSNLLSKLLEEGAHKTR